jgi:hypothetical protein
VLALFGDLFVVAAGFVVALQVEVGGAEDIA